MLIYENRISVGVNRNKTGWTRGTLISFTQQRDATSLQLLLKYAHISEVIKRIGIAVPAWIERQHVVFEHSLEETDGMTAIP